MKVKRVIRVLESQGFRIQLADGSKRKVYPPNKNMPFYSWHVSLYDERCILPLAKFAKQNWNINLL